MERNKNILDRIGSLIPGYKGYSIRDEKRNSDKKLREHLSNTLQHVESSIIEHQNYLINKKDLNTCQEWEVIRKSLNTLLTKLKYAKYGESPFFSESQIKEYELDEIYQIDLRISERIDLLFNLINKHIKEVLAPISMNESLKQLELLMIERSILISNYK
jgi:hypothetical protein